MCFRFIPNGIISHQGIMLKILQAIN